MKRASFVAGASFATLVAVGTVWLSHVPVISSPGDTAVLRVAFRARPERIETCVEQSPEALAQLPPHMRQARICEGTTASYRLEIWRDGALVAEHRVHGGGLRQDRPLYVFHEVSMPAGAARVTVRFAREREGEDEDDRESDQTAEREDLRQAVPRELTLERELTFNPRAVVVVSYDPDRRELVTLP
jgi:hypothetical protein